MNGDIQLFGDVEVQQLFDEMNASQQRTVIISGMKKAVVPFMNAVRQNSYRKGVSSRVAEAVASTNITGETGIYVGIKKKGHGMAWLANIENKGAERRKRGIIQPTHFWDEALDSNRDQIMENVANEMLASMNRYMKRIIRKYK